MKLRAISLVVAIAVFATVSAAQTTGSRYIGYEYKGVTPESVLPNGVKHLGGGLIGDFEAEVVYGISQVRIGKTHMLWLEASTGKDASGITGWKVLDVLSFSTLAKARYIFLTGDPAIGCSRFGKEIPNLVGAGQILRRQSIFKPTNLWVANLTSKKFEPTSTRGVKCQYSEP